MNKKNRYSVLVVDDDAKLLASLSSILEENGYRVLTGANGYEAEKMLMASSLDAVILDLILPDTDGITLLKKIHHEKPFLPVIMLTGHGTIAKAVEATKLGAFDFFEKPTEFKRILITLGNALKNSILKKERTFLIEDALERYRMIGVSPAMKHVFEMIEKVAPTDSRVLISGENGTGKELVARALHLRSERAGNQMITVNCSAIPPDLMESELFGHEKGSFSGAIQQQTGKFMLASRSTLFLDEIGEMDLRLQPKVLRAIENGEIQRVGGNDVLNVDVRLIAATNRDLKAAVQKKEFREDLFFRLSVINIHIPPLRERREDIPLLAEYFMTGLCRQRKRQPVQLSPAAVAKMLEYPWPGNVRELRNLMEKIAVLSDSEIVSGEEMDRYLNENRRSQSPVEDNPGAATLADIRRNKEKDAIEAKLAAADWNHKKAAADLGIARSTLFSKIKEYGVKRKKS